MSMEKDCYVQIRGQEKQAKEEIKNKLDDEENILKLRTTKDKDDIFSKVLEKSITDKAREKSKVIRDKYDDEKGQEGSEIDYIGAAMERLGYGTQSLTYEEASSVKTEVLNKLKERLIARAEIINKRMQKENEDLVNKRHQFNKKSEQHTLSPEEEQEFDEYVNHVQFKIDILAQRAGLHEEKAMKKYSDMDTKLYNDPRLVALRHKQKK